MGRQFVVRIRLLVWAVFQIGLSAACLVLTILTVVGAATTVVWVGLPIIFAAVLATRPIAGVYRNIGGQLIGDRIPRPYLRLAGGNLFTRLRMLARDPATWRDAAWAAVNGTVGLVFSILALLEALLDLLFWWLPPAVFSRITAYIARGLLSPNEKSRLALRVQELTESRAETVDTQAAELRRIERDLHDGAQARLVSLGMSLGLAEARLDDDPEGVRRLLLEARASSSAALGELRDLVRGIHPPVLADRGLVGAVHALALACPVPAVVQAEIAQRLPAPVESAAYFTIAEALANVAKHSGAAHVAIGLRHVDGVLHIQVSDDGVGGAQAEGGSGLRGIERRLSAFDGRLAVISPPGGPTTLTMELPCALSSPKTLPSSGTG